MALTPQLACGESPSSTLTGGFGSGDGSNSKYGMTQQGLSGNGGVYFFHALFNESSCLDVYEDDSDNGTQIEEYGCNGSGAQAFKVVDIGNGMVNLVHLDSGKCVDVYGAGANWGTNIVLWPCNSQDVAEQFFIQTDPAGDWTFYNPNSGQCLDVTGANPQNLTPIETWPCNYNGNQKWWPELVNPLPLVLSSATFEQMFPNRNPFYTYDDFVSVSTSPSPAFAIDGTIDDRKRDVAAFLANVNRETGGLQYINEINPPMDYCDPQPGCDCAPGQQYYGRGSLQISHNQNYCDASQALYGNPDVLRTSPDLVSQSDSLAWATGLWFWTSTACHNDIVQQENFGATIQTINGALECNGANPDAVNERINAYLQFCQLLGVDPGTNLGC
jgi:chitinase